MARHRQHRGDGGQAAHSDMNNSETRSLLARTRVGRASLGGSVRTWRSSCKHSVHRTRARGVRAPSSRGRARNAHRRACPPVRTPPPSHATEAQTQEAARKRATLNRNNRFRDGRDETPAGGWRARGEKIERVVQGRGAVPAVAGLSRRHSHATGTTHANATAKCERPRHTHCSGPS